LGFGGESMKRFRVGSVKGESPHRTADQFLELSDIFTSISAAWGRYVSKEKRRKYLIGLLQIYAKGVNKEPFGSILRPD